MGDNQFTDSVQALLKGLDGFISERTVVGNPITVNDTVILPLMDVQIGVGAGAYAAKSNGTAGGMGAKMTPTALLLLQNGAARIIRISNQDAVSKVIDMVPDVIDRIKAGKVKKDPEVDAKVEEILKESEDAKEES